MKINTNNDSLEFSPNATIELKNYSLQCAKFDIISDTWLCGSAANYITTKDDPIVQKAQKLGQSITQYGKTNKVVTFRGAFPKGFLKRFYDSFRHYLPESDKFLHVCAGRVQKESRYGKRLDISPLFEPDYLCMAEAFTEVYPECKDNFEFLLSDTPYNDDASIKYWNLPMVNRSKVLRQMNIACRIGGYIAVFDEQFPHNPKNLKVVARIAVSSVPNLTFRALTVFQKVEEL